MHVNFAKQVRHKYRRVRQKFDVMGKMYTNKTRGFTS